MVIDDTLFEIKTTVKPKVSVDMLRQCVGYWLLDYSDLFGIRKVAVELPRQSFTKIVDVREDLLSPEHRHLTDQQIQDRFREAIRDVKRTLVGR